MSRGRVLAVRSRCALLPVALALLLAACDLGPLSEAVFTDPVPRVTASPLSNEEASAPQHTGGPDAPRVTASPGVRASRTPGPRSLRGGSGRQKAEGEGRTPAPGDRTSFSRTRPTPSRQPGGHGATHDPGRVGEGATSGSWDGGAWDAGRRGQ